MTGVEGGVAAAATAVAAGVAKLDTVGKRLAGSSVCQAVSCWINE